MSDFIRAPIFGQSVATHQLPVQSGLKVAFPSTQSVKPPNREQVMQMQQLDAGVLQTLAKSATTRGSAVKLPGITTPSTPTEAPPIQTKRTVGVAQDQSEQEADRVAEQGVPSIHPDGDKMPFKRGEYQPGRQEGQELITHELTPVVQQQGGGATPSIQGKFMWKRQGKRQDVLTSGLKSLTKDSHEFHYRTLCDLYDKYMKTKAGSEAEMSALTALEFSAELYKNKYLSSKEPRHKGEDKPADVFRLIKMIEREHEKVEYMKQKKPGTVKTGKITASLGSGAFKLDEQTGHILGQKNVDITAWAAAHGVDEVEAMAIHLYSTQAYAWINPLVRGGDLAGLAKSDKIDPGTQAALQNYQDQLGYEAANQELQEQAKREARLVKSGLKKVQKTQQAKHGKMITVYRGEVWDTEKQVKQTYVPGEVKRVDPAPVSTTQPENPTQGFKAALGLCGQLMGFTTGKNMNDLSKLNDDRWAVLIELKLTRGADIRNVSASKNENEYLVQPNSKFVVQKIERFTDLTPVDGTGIASNGYRVWMVEQQKR